MEITKYKWQQTGEHNNFVYALNDRGTNAFCFNVQGANDPFQPFITEDEAQDLDRAYLMLMGYNNGLKSNNSIWEKFKAKESDVKKI